MSVSLTLVYDRSQLDVSLKNEKGRYSHVDLNRVGEAVNAIGDLLNQYGYVNTIEAKEDWEVSDTPTQAQMEKYLSDISALKTLVGSSASMPALPQSMRFLTWQKANDIEELLLNLYNIVIVLIASFNPLGSYFTGEEYL